MELDQQVAVITGGASGIGAATARMMAAAGATVARSSTATRLRPTPWLLNWKRPAKAP